MAGKYNYNVVFERDISTPISTHKTLGIWQSSNSNPYSGHSYGTFYKLFSISFLTMSNGVCTNPVALARVNSSYLLVEKMVVIKSISNLLC